jgi:hypothetical protein
MYVNEIIKIMYGTLLQVTLVVQRCVGYECWEGIIFFSILLNRIKT